MKITLEPLGPGNYVVAVSGGVDSMALLHVLQAQPGLRLTVAHFDHGIRPDSGEDRRLAQQVAEKYGLPFVFAEGRLGSKASEAAARQSRYQFLHKVRQAARAEAVVTAHHQDDALETAIINLARGTGRRGLTSLRSTDATRRPLLHVPKADIRKFAAMEGLVWREDSTNQDTSYLRNHIRHNVVATMSPEQRKRLYDLIDRMRQTNDELDALLQEYMQAQHEQSQLDRHQFIMLPHAVALEVMATWLRQNDLRDFDTKALERVVHAAKIRESGKQVDIQTSSTMQVGKDHLALLRKER